MSEINKAYHNLGLRIAEMFPDVPFDKIVKAVEEAKGNLDAALSILLNVTFIEEEDQLAKKPKPQPTPPSTPTKAVSNPSPPKTETKPDTTTVTNRDSLKRPWLISFDEEPGQEKSQKNTDSLSPTTKVNNSKTNSLLDTDNVLSNVAPIKPEKMEVSNEAASEDKKYDKMVAELGEMFPGVNPQALLSIIKHNNGDMGKAIDEILEEKVRQDKKAVLKRSQEVSASFQGGVPSLKFLCLFKISENWKKFAPIVEKMKQREIQNSILFFMSENNLLPDVEENQETSIEDTEGFDELNAEFAKIMGSSGDSIDWFSDDMDQLHMDEEIAKTLEAMDKDIFTKMKQREEEDRKFAIQLAMQEEKGSLKQSEDEKIARQLAAEEMDRKLAKEMYEKEINETKKKRELEKKREEEDYQLAKTLLSLEEQEKLEEKMKLERERKDAEAAKKLKELEEDYIKQKKQKEIENERLSQELIKKLQEEDKPKHDPMDIDTPHTGDVSQKEYINDFKRELAKKNLKNLFKGKVKIENILSSALAEKFEKKWMEFKMKYKYDSKFTNAEIVFHGTAVGNIPNIVKKGLLVPGTNGVGHATDTGFYGKGIYLSPNPALSVGYCRGGGKLLVCAVLMGNRFHCPGLMQGVPCKKGYDSHVSPDGQEFVLFSASQVLPLFVINFASNSVNYSYQWNNPGNSTGYGKKKKNSNNNNDDVDDLFVDGDYGQNDGDYVVEDAPTTTFTGYVSGTAKKYLGKWWHK